MHKTNEKTEFKIEQLQIIQSPLESGHSTIDAHFNFICSTVQKVSIFAFKRAQLRLNKNYRHPAADTH